MSWREPVVQSVRVLGLFVRARILIAVIQTILFAIGFAFARVPLWPLIAIAGGLASFIPRIGVLVPLVLVAIADLFGGVDLLHWTYAFGVWFGRRPPHHSLLRIVRGSACIWTVYGLHGLENRCCRILSL